ncbi:guanine nucleotide-binding protein alpha-2 subunit, partial [Reticulomyxa filosa]
SPDRYGSFKINLDEDVNLVEDKKQYQMLQDIRLCMAFHRETFQSGIFVNEESKSEVKEEDNDYDPNYVNQWTLQTYSKGPGRALVESSHLDWVIMKGLGHAIQRLWNNDILKKTYELRGVEKYAIIENIDYFLDKAVTLFQQHYFPTIEDMIKVRIRTTGIVEAVYEAKEKKDITLQIFDVGLFRNFFLFLLFLLLLLLCVGIHISLCMHFARGGENNLFPFVGGQRSERRKWISQFVNITAVIFMVWTFFFSFFFRFFVLKQIKCIRICLPCKTLM